MHAFFLLYDEFRIFRYNHIIKLRISNVELCSVGLFIWAEGILVTFRQVYKRDLALI